MQTERGLRLLLAPKNLQLSCLDLSRWKGWDLAILFLAGSHILAGPATLGSRDLPPEAHNRASIPLLQL